MTGCCGCCTALKPRYKRLVDSIFPDNPEDGLVKDNMQKLVYYGTSKPEKLDRIGQYLEQRLSRDVTRSRTGYVSISMEALDQLLLACHAHSNLFVESFLKMVHKTLESPEPQLQILASQSFVKFANIEEDTPSYHRSYDFFVSKFSSMCHSSAEPETTRIRIRVAGLHGLQGIVKKTVSDDLQVNIWDPVHMNKIIPSLLYSLQGCNMDNDPESPKEDESPGVVAEMVLRDLVCRATFGNITSVLKPVLQHLDYHKLWVPNKFAVKIFRILMYSVQDQYGHMVVHHLMSHLDAHNKDEPRVKAGIVDVVSETVVIAAGGSVGPSVLEVFNTLLRHLKSSVSVQTSDRQRVLDEKNFQEAVINTIGEFANNLPDYQKIEIMMFVMGKVPLLDLEEDVSSGDRKDTLLQTMLLKTMLKVATKYRTVLMINAFPPAFLDPLLRMSLAYDAGIRLIVQEILHTLLDRHDNSGKLKFVRIPKDIQALNLTVEKASQQDIFFIKKNGPQFYSCIYENMLQENNKVDNFEALYCTLALLSIELGGEDILVDLVRLAMGIQNISVSSDLPVTHTCAIHAIVAAYLNLIGQLSAIPNMCTHVSEIIDARKNKAPHLLPDFAFNRSNTEQSYPTSTNVKDELLFDQAVINEALTSRGYDTSTLGTPFTISRLSQSRLGRMDSWFAETSSGSWLQDEVDMAHSTSDIHSITLSIDSSSSSQTPLMGQRGQAPEDITFESLKKIITEDDVERKRSQEMKQKAILEKFQTAPFEQIVAKIDAESMVFQNKLSEILTTISDENKDNAPQHQTTAVFDMQFPDLYVY
ncbi:protein EFR3 homolog B isoform X3 [Lingula anatina]|uniref:Protein EFR3 homolog B isoform X3 n=1 Tax=Lingula anatina TaxID=7574 RepID=A0A1S3GZ32_LINAN|nr:protein EFR3 homolog B isoform X3 [Lingula anatina]|eukprot:XP_013379018.1 protein EFR3 homolog B isoform X3 [Lingula anatina]